MKNITYKSIIFEGKVTNYVIWFYPERYEIVNTDSTPVWSIKDAYLVYLQIATIMQIEI